MALTTLLLRPQKPIAGKERRSLLFNSMGLGLLLCLPLVTACGPGGDIGNGALVAAPGNGKGNGYGLNKNSTTFSVSPTGLAFSATQGGSDPAAQAVTISNSGNGTLNWSVDTTAGWVLLSQASGTTPGSFTVGTVISGLAAGTYSTTIAVTGNGSNNTPQYIPVDLTISPSTSTTSSSTSTTSTAPSTATVTLAWDPVQDPTVTGYYVHYGLQSPNSAGSCAYAQSSFSSSPAVTVTGLAPNTTYYFSVSAYNGLESACSSEVSAFTQAA